MKSSHSESTLLRLRHVLLDHRPSVQRLADQFVELAKLEKRVRTNLKGLGYEV